VGRLRADDASAGPRDVAFGELAIVGVADRGGPGQQLWSRCRFAVGQGDGGQTLQSGRREPHLSGGFGVPQQPLVTVLGGSGVTEMFVGGSDPANASPVGTATSSRWKPSWAWTNKARAAAYCPRSEAMIACP